MPDFREHVRRENRQVWRWGVLALAVMTQIANGGASRSEQGLPTEAPSYIGPEDFSGVMYREGQFGSDGRMEIPLLVDHTVRRLGLVLEATEFGDGVLRRPGGQIVGDGTPGFGSTARKSGRSMSIEKPEPGEWRLEFRGSGRYSVGARVQSPVRVSSFKFVERDESVDWGYKPISGAPVAVPGVDVWAEAVVEGGATTASFTLETDSGQVLGKLSMAPLDFDGAGAKYRGVVPLPAVPFRVVASGKVATPEGKTPAGGGSYRRVFPAMFVARSVGVEVVGSRSVRASAGQTVLLGYRVHNYGSPKIFTMTAIHPGGLVTRVIPEQVSIEQDEAADVRMEVTLTPKVRAGVQHAVTLKAHHRASVEASNAVDRTIELVAARP